MGIALGATLNLSGQDSITNAATTIVSRQVAAYNARDLDAFANCYTENVWVGRFPSNLFYKGRDTLRQKYSDYFDRVANTQVEVLQRIALGNIVIDKELATDGEQKTHQVAIYTVTAGGIAQMNFIFDEDVPDPVPIVAQQLEAYNNRDIEGFMKTYTEDVRLFNYPDQPLSQGQAPMRANYKGFFENTPDLNCEIKNRIVIGNKVIDQDYLTINGKPYSAIAVYEVEAGKIARVTFIQP